MVSRQRALRSVDSEGGGRVIEPRKFAIVGVVVRWSVRRQQAPGVKGKSGAPTGVREHGIRPQGLPQEPGRSRRLAVQEDGPRGSVTTIAPGPRTIVPSPRGSESRAPLRNRLAKETKRGGTGVGKSERPIVPMKAGNQPNGTRWREGGAGEEEP